MRGFFDFEHRAGEAVLYAALDGFSDENHIEAFRVFASSCQAIAENQPQLRPARDPCRALTAVCHEALAYPLRNAQDARWFFETHFTAHRVLPRADLERGFVTGYYEPVVEGSLTPDLDFSAPLFARPDDLVTLPQGETLAAPDGPLQAGRAGPHGLEPYPDRAAIEAGVLHNHLRPLVWLRDMAEAYFIHVQGSARVKLRTGSDMRLTYAGRNGHPYTSIGRILTEEEKIPPAQAGLAGLKDWIRAKGQAPGEEGRALMLRNKSFIFFDLNKVLTDAGGPIGGQGIGLTAMRSIAVDRTLWPYGLPFWIEAELPWRSSSLEKFRRLMIAQDTGSAILGASRADLFFGSGDEAGMLAGAIRHPADFTVLLPRNPHSQP